MVMKDNGCKRKRKLDWKCQNCRNRWSLQELLDEGYCEKTLGIVSVECPECGYKEVIKK